MVLEQLSVSSLNGRLYQWFSVCVRDGGRGGIPYLCWDFSQITRLKLLRNPQRSAQTGSPGDRLFSGCFCRDNRLQRCHSAGICCRGKSTRRSSGLCFCCFVFCPSDGSSRWFRRFSRFWVEVIRRAAKIKSLKLKLAKIDVNSERVALQLCRISTPTRKIYMFMYRSSRHKLTFYLRLMKIKIHVIDLLNESEWKIIPQRLSSCILSNPGMLFSGCRGICFAVWLLFITILVQICDSVNTFCLNSNPHVIIPV